VVYILYSLSHNHLNGFPINLACFVTHLQHGKDLCVLCGQLLPGTEGMQCFLIMFLCSSSMVMPNFKILHSLVFNPLR